MLNGMLFQIAVRLPPELLEALDDLVRRGRYENRAAAVRAGIRAIAEEDRRRHLDEAIAEGYRRLPPSREEERAAADSLRQAIAEEPW